MGIFSKLLTFFEIMIGAGLLLFGISGFFSYFLFNALIAVMGFVILLDGLGKIDDPAKRQQNNTTNNNDENKT